jgi:hypothetical protein
MDARSGNARKARAESKDAESLKLGEQLNSDYTTE